MTCSVQGGGPLAGGDNSAWKAHGSHLGKGMFGGSVVELEGEDHGWGRGVDFVLEYQSGAHSQADHIALPLQGVRVLEVARRTWAAPLCGQMLAASGADVIRVSFDFIEPRHEADGGMMQAMRSLTSKPPVPLPVYDPATGPFVPESFHVGKAVAPYNPNVSEESKRIRLDVLPGADMLLTDLTTDELKRLFLDRSEVHHQFPHVIHATVSAVSEKADAEAPGVEDSGAFCSLTGLASPLHGDEGRRGLAAATGASALFGALCLAVLRRRCGGTGDTVHLSLLRTGRWCAAATALTGWHGLARPYDGPERHPKAVHCAPALPFEVEGAANVKPTTIAQSPIAGIYGPQGMKFWGWRRHGVGVDMPRPHETSPVASEAPLARVRAIEISDEYNLSVAGLGRLLVDFGAQVTVVEKPGRTNPWRKNCPRLFEAMSAGKVVEVVDYGSVKGAAELLRAFTDATMFVTNLPLRALEEWGLTPERLQATYPHLIILLVSTWGRDAAAAAREATEAIKGGEVRAFWEASGLSSRCFQSDPAPMGLTELALSQHGMAGVGIALLRQQRTGVGQIVHVCRHRAGLFTRMICESSPQNTVVSPLFETLDGVVLRMLWHGHSPAEVRKFVSSFRSSSWSQRLQASFYPSAPPTTWSEVKADLDFMEDIAAQMDYTKFASELHAQGLHWFVEEVPSGADAEKHEEKLKKIHQQQQQGGWLRRNKTEPQSVKSVRPTLLTPSSVKPELWLDAVCGNQPLAPAAIISRPVTSVSDISSSRALVGRKAAAAVAAPPDLVPTVSPVNHVKLFREVPPHQLYTIRVTVIEAEGLGLQEARPPTAYCTCEIAGKPHTRFQTPVAERSHHPQWYLDPCELSSFILGDQLRFSLWDRNTLGPDGRALLLGEARLPPGSLSAYGFDDWLQVSGPEAAAGARLRVKVDVPLSKESLAAQGAAMTLADLTGAVPSQQPILQPANEGPTMTLKDLVGVENVQTLTLDALAKS